MMNTAEMPDCGDEWTVPCRQWSLRLSARRMHVMGVVNITPDSFSDGGACYDPARAVDRAVQLAFEGADSIDLGAESTRPGARAVPADEQVRRLREVVRPLAAQLRVPISIDTSSAAVARHCLDWGAAIINDVTALRKDTHLATVIARNRAAVVLMHMRGTPRTMQQRARYLNLIPDVMRFLQRRRTYALDAGIAAERIIIDPGIGFGKTVSQNLLLLRRIREFSCVRCPVLVGPSRKSFIGAVADAAVEDRLAGTLACVTWLALNGVAMVRVHDVREARQAVNVLAAIRDAQKNDTGTLRVS